MLVIGVKTAVVTSLPRRQAIRDTWGNPATLPHDVKVLFLGCEPNMTVFRYEHERRRVLKALAKERAVYKDLLTEELECTDSYRNLSKKVKSFMHLAAAEFPDAKFVMLVDDDVYVKVDQLVQHLRLANVPRLYFGEVWADKFANKQEPIRDPDSPYHLPKDQYPMSGLLPYGSGPHYAVSMDGVRFIAKNCWKLRSMNGLEDVSSGFWLRLMQIPAQHTAEFSSIRSSMSCEDDLVSFADLSPLGIRSIHANVVNKRRFCHGFHSVTWHRHLNSIPNLKQILQRSTQHAVHSTPLQVETYVDSSDPLRFVVIVSTPSKAGMKFGFTPSTESTDDFIQRICPQLSHDSAPCEAVSLTFVKQLEKALQ
ncbi:hypothetical protein PHYSODRAFT_523894 [Phytophthora sojae]|uniref:Hexosyltransferase n=1 Tax=Phytophthora sojae (strain P6497) TaxID=1094619 RepID=G5A4X1_PHYSP|nr:hypothetical protein PHYSODRAFT_523894 [Phytophthora sojae]EGZ09720.1 hypothetical protein PHYSODRAFT_523894 [Phytophthora sojae]|eukprot:XP_009534581.1 hypothetical protein PHYSODRAFT_523894 [Phytophthora sojae]